jgi:maltose phosphorylase
MLNGKRIDVDATRFISMVRQDAAAIKYAIKADSRSDIQIVSHVNSNVRNADANYDEKFWNTNFSEINELTGIIVAETKKTAFVVATGFTTIVEKNGKTVTLNPACEHKDEQVSQIFTIAANEGDEIIIYKYVSVNTTLQYPEDELLKKCKSNLSIFRILGFNQLLQEHIEHWKQQWAISDIKIQGDIEAQQGIRFNIFQLHQTYTGTDARLNIGPKGFTGEKYGGSTYWDTEAYCLPFYLSTAKPEVAKNLLLYRYKQLNKAIENAQKLGFTNGAALFPMVTMNGEECHNEWEITFEEIHRNGAIAFAVYDYVRYTGDKNYLEDFGLELLIGISRFWKQRITFSSAKNQYVMLGVTGPNEYENNVNNNWYTNQMACWTLKYTAEVYAQIRKSNAVKIKDLSIKIDFKESELTDWKAIVENMYYPKDENLGIILQQEGYMDKEQILAADIPASQRPINQHWSWDRILRSCFIKQADVVQGLYCLEDQFSLDTIKKNFAFYEARTVHESSLSPCIHSVVASKIKDLDKAYNLYLRTARLDLDDYNNEAREGLHITSMSGSWLAIVKGFAGMRVKADMLCFDPIIPKQWQSYSFRINFRSHALLITISPLQVEIKNVSARELTVKIREQFVLLPSNQSIVHLN